MEWLTILRDSHLLLMTLLPLGKTQMATRFNTRTTAVFRSHPMATGFIHGWPQGVIQILSIAPFPPYRLRLPQPTQQVVLALFRFTRRRSGKFRVSAHLHPLH